MSERKVTAVLDGEGNEIQATYAAPRITISFERKIGEAHGLPQYESAVAYAAVQADVSLDGSDRVAALTEAFQLAKSAVYAQLGVEHETNDVGVVVEKLKAVFKGEVTHQTAAPKAKSAPARSTGTGGAKRTEATLWAELADDPGKFWDNREGKSNPNAPDFKRAGTNEGLWLTAKDGSFNPDTFGITLPESGYKKNRNQ